MIESSDPRTLDDAALAHVCAKRPPDQAAWMEFWGRYSFAVRAALRPLLIGKDPEMIEDAVQSAFLKIFQSLGHFDPERGPLLPFLRRVARNELLDGLRREKRREETTITLTDEIAAALAASPLAISPALFYKAVDAELQKVHDGRRLHGYQMLIEGADVSSIQKELSISRASAYRLRDECVDLVLRGVARHHQTQF